MGTVYTAHDVKLEREVALKMMKREMAADPASLQAFYREARAGASSTTLTSFIFTASMNSRGSLTW